MNQDVTALARVIDRFDASATFRSFTLPGALVASWAYLAVLAVDAARDDYGLEVVFAVALSAVGAAVAPLFAVLYDAFARQAWRPVSGAIALLAGGAVQLVYAGGAVVLAAALIALPFDAELRALAADLRSRLGELGPVMLAAGALVYVLLPIWLMRRTVQVETELAKPTPRAVLLGDLGGAGLWPRLAYIFGVPSSLWRAGALLRIELWLFIAARVAVYAAVLPVSQLLADLEERPPAPIDPGVLVVAAAGLLAGGHALFWLAKRLAARRIWAMQPSASRKPVLFLRSFEDDQFAFARPWYDLVGHWLGLWSFRRNADEVLIDEFAREGPILALGQPGETRTPFGAWRRYVDHDDWKAVVRDAAGDAEAIVVAAGETPGLKWEYDLVKAGGALDKTIFLFQPARRGSPEVARALATLREVFPDLAVAPPPNKSLIAVRAENGVARAVVADRPTASAYVAALRQFVQDRDAAAGYRTGDGPMPVGALIGAAAGFLLGAIVMLAVGQSMFG
jgi:hypothetical protein